MKEIKDLNYLSYRELKKEKSNMEYNLDILNSIDTTKAKETVDKYNELLNFTNLKLEYLLERDSFIWGIIVLNILPFVEGILGLTVLEQPILGIILLLISLFFTFLNCKASIGDMIKNKKKLKEIREKDFDRKHKLGEYR